MQPVMQHLTIQSPKCGQVGDNIPNKIYLTKSLKLSGTKSIKFIICPFGGFNTADPEYANLPVPNELMTKAEKMSNAPKVWFISQMEEFLFELKPQYKRYIDDIAIEMGFVHPIVGVHIRRTDKKTETYFIGIERYMERVEEFYDTLELTAKIDKRRIFLASDDSTIIEKVIKEYSNRFEILTNISRAREAEQYSNREHSILEIITDVHLLSRCDHFVGTLSSNIGRRVFEFMYRTNFDAPERVLSVDKYFVDVEHSESPYKVLISHKFDDGSEVKVGDVVTTQDYNVHKGEKIIKFKGETGKIPIYKIQYMTNTADYPKLGDF